MPDGDEGSYIDENANDVFPENDHNYLDADENHAQGYTADSAKPDSNRVCEAFKLCCCCCCIRTTDKSTIVVDPENGTVMSVESEAAIKEKSCCDKFFDVWLWFRSHVKSFIYSFWFENGIMLCIIINTLCLALDSPGISSEVDAYLSKINDVSNV